MADDCVQIDRREHHTETLAQARLGKVQQIGDQMVGAFGGACEAVERALLVVAGTAAV
jgi:hypothetical protein